MRHVWQPNVGTLAYFTEDMMFVAGESTTYGARPEVFCAVDSIVRLTELACPSVGRTQILVFHADQRTFLTNSIPAYSTGVAVIGANSLSTGHALGKVTRDVAPFGTTQVTSYTAVVADSLPSPPVKR